MTKLDLKEYVRRGAEARLAELEAEMTAILRAFPDMRRGRKGGDVARGADRQRAGAVGAARRTRTPMTPAQRKAVSARMKKYWAAKRKAKNAN